MVAMKTSQTSAADCFQPGSTLHRVSGTTVMHLESGEGGHPAENSAVRDCRGGKRRQTYYEKRLFMLNFN